ncbi:MAG: AzlC family ABC transporter permease [Hyphomicrobiales bacterium]|nr:AzlC family ABC transporter permease [Hyphomicrobiales bacterium]
MSAGAGMGRDFAAEFRDGARDVLPAVIAVIPFALLIGALAAQKGLGTTATITMSATVFAGASQFVALGLWSEPAPILLIVAATALVNASHLLMGASLAPRLREFSPAKRHLCLFFLVDESWALAERRAREKTLTPAYYAGLMVPLYSVWVVFTAIGALAGAAIEEPRRFGFDFAFTAIFIGLIVALARDRASLAVVAASGVAAALIHLVAPGPLPILAGSLAGLTAAAFLGKGGQP